MNSFATIHLIRRGGTAAKPGRPDTSRGLALVPGAPAGLEAGTKAGIEPPVVGGVGSAVGNSPSTKFAASSVPALSGVPVKTGREEPGCSERGKQTGGDG